MTRNILRLTADACPQTILKSKKRMMQIVLYIRIYRSSSVLRDIGIKMSLVQVNEVSQEFSANYVLKEINCSLEHNSRIGLIGPNGCGKSTLIKIMLGQLAPSEGTVVRAKKARFAYLPQSMKLDPELVMIDYIMSSRPDFVKINREIEELSLALQTRHDERTETLLNKAIDEYHNLGAYDFDNQVKYVLISLNFPEDTWHKHIRYFSGGEQTRICLAAILLAPFDLLILDEPTNHLDIAMINWLEKYLTSLEKPFLVVSHDRRFLDNTVNNIWLLREQRLSVTKGNYSSFKAADEIALAAQLKAAKAQEKWIETTEAFIAKNMAGQKTKQAQSRLKQLQKVERITSPHAAKQIKLNIETSGRSGNDVFMLQDMTLGINSSLVLASNIQLWAHYQDRICIIGPNGCGKTTLLKLLLGERQPLRGTIKIGASLKTGYYDQHQISLDEKLSVKETLWQLVPLEPVGYVLGWLARFGFRGDEVDKQVSVLSGGEKSRLYLCILIHQKPNLLVLDEPTNHLDIEMTDNLLSALRDYSGTIVFVSHDRYFIDQLANKYWVFNQQLDSQHQLFTTIDELQDDLESAIELSFAIPEAPKEKAVPRQKKKKKNPWFLEQIQKNIDDENTRLQGFKTMLTEVHDKLAESATYTEPGLASKLQDEMNDLELKISACKQRLETLEDDYLEESYD